MLAVVKIAGEVFMDDKAIPALGPGIALCSGALWVGQHYCTSHCWDRLVQLAIVCCLVLIPCLTQTCHQQPQCEPHNQTNIPTTSMVPQFTHTHLRGILFGAPGSNSTLMGIAVYSWVFYCTASGVKPSLGRSTTSIARPSTLPTHR